MWPCERSGRGAVGMGGSAGVAANESAQESWSLPSREARHREVRARKIVHTVLTVPGTAIWYCIDSRACIYARGIIATFAWHLTDPGSYTSLDLVPVHNDTFVY